MGRPSKLTDKQWADIKRRILDGDKPADLAREYGVSRATISTRVSKRVEEIKAVANQVVTAERALGGLPIAEQLLTLDLVSQLRAMSASLAQAGALGAKTAHRLQALANSEVGKVDDADPLASMEALKGVNVLTKLANDSASIALNLLAANKERVQQLDSQPDPNAAPTSGVLEVPAMSMHADEWSAAVRKGKTDPVPVLPASAPPAPAGFQPPRRHER